MFLVLLTLYCVIHFIINSLHNITLSVLGYFIIVRIVIIFNVQLMLSNNNQLSRAKIPPGLNL